MSKVKKDVWDSHMKGNQTAFKSASREALKDFDRELRKLRMPDSKQQERACDLLCAKGRMLRFLGDMDAAAAVFEEGLAYPITKNNPILDARFRTERGMTQMHTGDYKKSEQDLIESLKIIKTSKSRTPLLSAIYGGIGACAWGHGDFKTSHKNYKKMLDEARKEKCPEFEAEALNNLAILEWKAGKLEKSLGNFRDSLKRWKKIENRFGIAITTMNIGILEENTGKFTPAKRRYLEAIKMGQEIGFSQLQAAALTNLSSLLLNQQLWQNAIERAKQSAQLANKIKDRRSEAIALENLALANLGKKEFVAADKALRHSRKIAEKIGDQERLFSLQLVQIEWLLAKKQIAEIQKLIQSSEQLYKKHKYESELPRFLRLQVQYHLQTGDSSKATGLIKIAFAECQKQKNKVEEKRLRKILKEKLDSK